MWVELQTERDATEERAWTIVCNMVVGVHWVQGTLGTGYTTKRRNVQTRSKSIPCTITPATMAKPNAGTEVLKNFWPALPAVDLHTALAWMYRVAASPKKMNAFHT